MPSHRFRKMIADRLKAGRAQRGMSLDATAKATGVSKAMLGQIERMESTPTIATLWKIATGMDISFSAFFTTAEAAEPDEAPFSGDPDMRIKVIFPFDPDTGMEIFEVTLTGRHHQVSPPHRHGVIEHVVVLRGRMAVLFEGQWHELDEGDAAKFHADVPHEYRADTDTAVFQNIIRYT